MFFKSSSYILFYMIIVLTSCSKGDNDDNHFWVGKEMSIPEIISNDKKIVTRIVGDCSPCMQTIDLWKEFYSIAKEKNSKIIFMFYVEAREEDRFEEIKHKLDFADYVIFDRKATFYKENLLKFSYTIEDHTFLLNGKNEIILFGNPMLKKELIRKYIEKI